MLAASFQLAQGSPPYTAFCSVDRLVDLAVNLEEKVSVVAQVLCFSTRKAACTEKALCH